MVGVSLVAAAMALDGNIGRLEALVLTIGLLSYTAFLFHQGRKQGMDTSDEEVEAMLKVKAPAWQNLLLVAGGLVLLVLGARWLVQSAVEIATMFGVSEAVIGLTIVAAGTSLPEVVTSVVATMRGERDIAVGNVVGSNIFNILSVLGLSGLVSPIPLLAGEQLVQLDLPVMLGAAILCVPLFFTGAILDRIEGSIFLALYVAYVWYLIALALALPYLPTLQNGIVFGLLPVMLVYITYSLWHSLRRR